MSAGCGGDSARSQVDRDTTVGWVVVVDAGTDAAVAGVDEVDIVVVELDVTGADVVADDPSAAPTTCSPPDPHPARSNSATKATPRALPIAVHLARPGARDVGGVVVEVSGFEPPTSTLRT